MNICSDTRVVILGAGMTGLSLAWTLQKKCQVSVLEKSGRAGGWIQTLHKDGFLFEQGPRNFRGEASLKFVQELGLQDQITYADPASKIRFLYENQTLQRLPHTLWEMFFAPIMKGVRRTFIKELFKKSSRKEETVYEFFSRRFNTCLVERFVDPFVTGIYAGDIHQLSLQACFPSLYAMEKQYGSVIKGFLFGKKSAKIPLFSLKNGMESVVAALEQKLIQPIRYHTEVKALAPKENHILLHLDNGDSMEADYVFCALPGNSLSKLFPHAAQKIEKIPYASLIVINLGYHHPVLKKKGFGYLVPSKEHEDILGVVWDSAVFPEQNRHSEQTRLTVMMGGMSRPNLCKLSQDKLLDLALNSVERHLGIAAQPDAFAIKFCQQAIPQYIVGHADISNAIRESIKTVSPRIEAIGPLFDGVGINEILLKTQKFLH